MKIIDGLRPEITEDTPEFYANLMKMCWDPDPNKRPSAWDILHALNFQLEQVELEQAELKRVKLIVSKKLGPKFSGKPHPKAIYTSRLISSYISECSSSECSKCSINSSNGMYTILIKVTFG